MSEVSPASFALFVHLLTQNGQPFSSLRARAVTGLPAYALSRAKAELIAKNWVDICPDSSKIFIAVCPSSVQKPLYKIAAFAKNTIKNNWYHFRDDLLFCKPLYRNINNKSNYINNIKLTRLNNLITIEAKMKKKSTAKGTRLSNDFEVTPEMVAWFDGRGLSVDLELETEKFKNHFAAVPGAKGLKLDWTATWRNWMLNAEGYAKARGGNWNGANQKPIGANRAKLDGYAELFAKYHREGDSD